MRWSKSYPLNSCAGEIIINWHDADAAYCNWCSHMKWSWDLYDKWMCSTHWKWHVKGLNWYHLWSFAYLKVSEFIHTQNNPQPDNLRSCRLVSSLDNLSAVVLDKLSSAAHKHRCMWVVSNIHSIVTQNYLPNRKATLI